jgi:hypothetical protein
VEIIIWLTIGILLGAYVFSKGIRTKFNLIVKESINSFRKDNDDDLLDDSKYDAIYDYNYSPKQLKSGKQEPAKQRAPRDNYANSKYTCAACSGPAEPVQGMTGFHYCEVCNKIVPIKKY